jgi:hypothetical protein
VDYRSSINHDNSIEHASDRGAVAPVEAMRMAATIVTSLHAAGHQ